MCITIKEFLAERIDDVVEFEKALRAQEDFWGWSIDEQYIQSIQNSFADERFKHSLSLLAYDGSHVVGRIDTTMIASRVDGTLKAYLDWICVLKSYRHMGIGQKLMQAIREQLKERGATEMVAIIAHNDEALRFYRALENADIRDEGIWIGL